jgi:hypothetical protein
MGFLSCALGVFLMGAHWLALFVCHKPWRFPRGWGGWMLIKATAILLAYPAGWYDPARDTVHYWPMRLEQLLIKRTHYQWIRSDFWRVVTVGGLFWGWRTGWFGIHQPHTVQGLIGLILMGWAAWDGISNRHYYCGEPPPSGDGEGHRSRQLDY